MLQTQASPRDLLKTIKSSKYANQAEAGKLLRLAESSIDAIMRFDKEIAMVLQGLSNATFGASCIIWGGLGVVFHVRDMHRYSSLGVGLLSLTKLTSHTLDFAGYL
jgi:hypothetical protein